MPLASRGGPRSAASRPAERRRRRRLRPILAALEDRTLLAPLTVTSPAASGAGSLAAAIGTANSNGQANTITFQGTIWNTPQTITLTGTQLTLSDTSGTQTITGPAAGVTVSGGGLSRVIQVNAGVTASISGLTITGGQTTGTGGGLMNVGTTTLNNCIISGNTSTFSAGGGGGVYNSGTANLTNCTISGNSASHNGGGLNTTAVPTPGTTTLTNCTISGNSADYGGGLINFATTTLINCTVSANHAISGGGVYDAGTTAITNSTISVNIASFGGGLWCGGAPTIGNTIVAGNTTSTSGPDVFGTVASNGHNLIGETDGSFGWVSSDLIGTIAAPLNPLVASLGNYGGPTQTMGLFAGSPALGAGSSALIPGGITTDQRGQPRIMNGTVDIGAYEAQTAFVPSYVVNTTADESDFSNSATSLREAIASANAVSGHTITFDASVFASARTITLTSGQLLLSNTSGTETITCPAAGVTVNGNNASRVFLVNTGVTASISGMTITGGRITGNGGGMLSYGAITLTGCTLTGNSATNGGALIKDGTATLVGCTVSGNSASRHGGGINSDSGTTTLNDCTITGNNAPYGGGLFNNADTTTLTNCTVSGNSANFGAGLNNFNATLGVTNSRILNNTGNFSTGGGGGVYNGGTATLTNCTISGNSVPGAGGSGGGVQTTGPTTLTGCLLSNNSVGYAGGGVYNFGATVTLTNCTVSGNSSSNRGGGVSATPAGGTTTLTDCTVSLNFAASGGGLFDQGVAGMIALGNTIVAGNTGTTSGPDALGTFGSRGHNLIGKTDGSSGWVAGSDLTGTIAVPQSAMLTSLGNYGGPTQTMALQPGSPAIGRGTGSSGITTDQRGAPRSASGSVGTIDIGAFQNQGYVVAAVSGSGQTTPPGTMFPDSLVARLTESFASSPIPEASLSFTAPTSGASATLSPPSAITDASGQVSVKATANGTAGAYTVNATATGVFPPAAFSLANNKLSAPVHVSDASDVYKGSAFAATATISPSDGPPNNTLQGIGITLTYYVGTGTSGTSLGSTPPTNVGTYTVVASYPGNNSYLPGSDQTGFTIAPAQLSAAIINTPTKTYNGNTNATLAPSNFSLSGLVGSESFTVTRTTGTYNSKDVASATTVTTSLAAGDFTAGNGTLASNYTLPTTASGPGAIVADGTTPSLQVFDAGGVYNGSPYAAAATIIPSDLLPNITLTYYVGTGTSGTSLGSTPPTNVGTYTVVASYPGNDSYPPGSAPASFAITPAQLSAAIINTPAKTYDSNTNATLASANFSLSGLVGSESFTVTRTTGTYNSKDVTSAATVTTSLSAGDFTAGNGTLASNYTLPTTASGGGAITARTVTASIIGAPTKTYDGNTNATLTSGNFSLTGLVGSESFTVTRTTGTYDSGDVSSASRVSTSLSAGDFSPANGAVATNYTLPGSTSGAGAITPAPVTAVIIGIPIRPYDGTDNATLTPANFSLTGLASGQSFTVTQPAGTYNSPNAGSATTVTANLPADSFTAGNGTLANNYTLPTTASGSGAIRPTTPAFSVNNSGGTYNGSPFPGVVSVTGVNGQASSELEGVAATILYHSGSTATGTVLPGAPINAGTYTVVAAFPGSADYTSGESAPVTFTIAPATPTIALSTSTGPAAYGQPVTLTATLGNIAGTPGGSIGFLDGSTLLATVPLVGGQPQVTLTLSSLAAGNHAITAAYSGNSNVQAVTSGSASASIAKAATHLVLVPNRVLKRKKVISLGLTATVEPVTPGADVPSGTLTLELMQKQGKKIRTVLLGSPVLSQGKATTALKPSQVLNKTITVIYNGDANFQSTMVAQTLK